MANCSEPRIAKTRRKSRSVPAGARLRCGGWRFMVIPWSSAQRLRCEIGGAMVRVDRKGERSGGSVAEDLVAFLASGRQSAGCQEGAFLLPRLDRSGQVECRVLHMVGQRLPVLLPVS